MDETPRRQPLPLQHRRVVVIPSGRPRRVRYQFVRLAEGRLHDDQRGVLLLCRQPVEQCGIERSDDFLNGRSQTGIDLEAFPPNPQLGAESRERIQR